MDQINDESSVLLQLLNVICNATVYEDDGRNEETNLVSRGPPCEAASHRSALHSILISNMKKKNLIEKIEGLKAAVKEKNETKGLHILASYLNEILDPGQRSGFIAGLNNNKMDETQMVTQKNNDSTELYAPIENQGSLKLPIECNYNQSEAYLIQKGIIYSRMVLNKFNMEMNNTMIRELKTKNVFDAVLKEPISGEKNYIMTLASIYPRSLEEIRFMLQEDRQAILESSLFVHLAQRNIRLLCDLLAELLKSVNENSLSQACAMSRHNGVSVRSCVNAVNSPEMKDWADQITRFLDRNDQSHLL